LIRVIIAIVALTFLYIGAQKTYFWVMPRVTIENLTSELITLAEVTLPSNRLSFSPIESGKSQLIYRRLDSLEGVYKYYFKFASTHEITGESGYVTSNEIFTNFRITVVSNNEVECAHESL
jgi:hypothetical protein